MGWALYDCWLEDGQGSFSKSQLAILYIPEGVFSCANVEDLENVASSMQSRWGCLSFFLIFFFYPHSKSVALLIFLGSSLRRRLCSCWNWPLLPRSLSKSGTVLAGTSAAVTHCKCFAFRDVLQGLGSPLWLEALDKLKASWKRGPTAAKTLQGWGRKLLGKLKKFCAAGTAASHSMIWACW